MQSTILAVDDDPIILDMYQAILGDLYRLDLVSSGEEALDFLNAQPRPDLILLDIMMPGVDGYKVCQKIRENPLFSHLKVILVSSKSLVEERLRGYQAGADEYIVKPFEENELIAKIKVFLRLKNVEEVNTIKSNFLSILSHETRTPLNGILGFAQLLQQSQNLTEEDRDFVEHIITCAQTLLQLSEKTLLLSELKLGNIQIERTQIKIDDLIHRCQQNLTQKAEEKHLLFQVQGDLEAKIDGDVKLLLYAFEMILDNAVKFAREGTSVEVTVSQVDHHVRINIANEGEKILDEHRDAICSGFFVQYIENHHRGYGLSLAIVERIVLMHQGTLSIENHDKGPVFVVDLPSSSEGCVGVSSCNSVEPVCPGSRGKLT